MLQADAAAAPRISIERAAVCAAFLANGFLVGSWAPQIPVFAARLGLTPAGLGLFIVLFGVGAIAVMPAVGLMIARFGSWRVMILAGLLSPFALPAVASSLTIAAGIPAVLFTGVLAGGMDVAMNANAVALERRLPFAIMSSCHGFWSLGGLFGAALGGPMIAAFGAAGHAVLVGAAILLLTVLIAKGALRDRPEKAVLPTSEDARGIDADPVRSGSDGMGGMTKAVLVGAFALMAMIPEGAILDWGAVYLRQDLGVGVSASGFAFAGFSTTMAIFRFAGDPLRDRLGAVRTARLSSLAAGAGLLLVASAGSLPVALAGFALAGVGISNMVPIAFSAAGNVEGLRPGVALSIMTIMGYSGTLIAPTPIGILAERVGFPTIFAALSLLLIATFFFAGLVARADRTTPGAL